MKNSHVLAPMTPAHLPSTHFANEAQQLKESGFCSLKTPWLTQPFVEMIGAYDKLGDETKTAFSFPGHTDGFLPYGMERSSNTGQIDQCERYCFREKYRLEHQRHSFCNSRFYALTSTVERVACATTQGILNCITSSYGLADPIAIRESSYLQFCAYRTLHSLPGRTFLQDRHEDGNLLSLIHASCDGLIIYPNGQPMEVTLAPDESLLITGSILSLLTDHEVPYMDHAVRPPALDVPRSSLVYFALPDLGRNYTSLVKHQRLDIEAEVNRLHQSFGNAPFTEA